MIGDNLAFELRRVIDSMPGAMKEVSQVAIRTIKERTRAGVDATGKPFIPYGERWRRSKQARGTYSGFANLVDTGEMVNSIGLVNTDFTNDRQVAFDTRLRGAQLRRLGSGQTASRDDVNIQIGVTDPTKARLVGIHTSGNYGRGPLKPRPFLALSEPEVDLIFREFSQRLHQVQPGTETETLTITLG